MKTSIDIPPALLEEARKRAHEKGTTIKSVVAEALRAYLAEPIEKPKFKLVDASYPGGGWAPGVDPEDREEFLARLYGDRTP